MRIQPNVELLVMDYLRDDGAISATGARIATAFDEERKDDLQIIVQRIGGGQDQYGHLDRAHVQIDVWAKPQRRADAFDVMQLVRGALLEAANGGGGHDRGAISRVREFNLTWLPDRRETGAPQRPRYVLDLEVISHS